MQMATSFIAGAASKELHIPLPSTVKPLDFKRSISIWNSFGWTHSDFENEMSQTVLITGASGFIAAHVVQQFLEAGYNFRATVRSEKTAAKVRKTHKKYGNALSFAIVPDLAAPGAFDEAVKGVDGAGIVDSVFLDSVLNCTQGYSYRFAILSRCEGLQQGALRACYPWYGICAGSSQAAQS
jgi:hypothetical protein